MVWDPIDAMNRTEIIGKRGRHGCMPLEVLKRFNPDVLAFGPKGELGMESQTLW